MTTPQMQRRAKERGKYGRYDTKPGTKSQRPYPKPEAPKGAGKFECGRIVRARLTVEAAHAAQRRRAEDYYTPKARHAPRRKP